MKHLLKRLSTGEILSRSEASSLMDEILSDRVPPEQLGFLLATYEFRTPTGEELAGLVEALLKRSISVGFNEPDLIDVCGTGGDGLGLFNISTCVSFVVAAAGLKVAKHGNRSVSSRCGSFDVLEALDVSTAHDILSAQHSMSELGLAFLYAPSFHPILGVLSPTRRNLGVRTIFNALGPLLNPGRVKRQLIGVYSEKLLIPMAQASHLLGSEEVMVVVGEDGNDEISLAARTQVAHLKGGSIRRFEINPAEFGFLPRQTAQVGGGAPAENAQILEAVLEGERGPHRDVTILNAGAALLVGGAVHSLSDGFRLAALTIDSGKASILLRRHQQQRIYA